MKLRTAVKEQKFKSEKEARLFCEKQEKLLKLEQEIADYKKRLHKFLGQIKILEKTLLGQKKQSEEEKQKKLEQTEQNLEKIRMELREIYKRISFYEKSLEQLKNCGKKAKKPERKDWHFCHFRIRHPEHLQENRKYPLNAMFSLHISNKLLWKQTRDWNR